MRASSLLTKAGAVAAVLALSAVLVSGGASVELRDAGIWRQTEHNEGTYSTYSLNAWFDVVTSSDSGQPIKKVYIELDSLDENFTVSNTFGVYATQHGFDSTLRKDVWHAEVRINNYVLWSVQPTEIRFTVKAEIGEQYGSMVYLYDEQNPHFLFKPMNAANPVRFLPETLLVRFNETAGPVVTGSVRVWDPKPSDLDKAVVEIRYTVDGWKTVQTETAEKVPAFIGVRNQFNFRIEELTRSADVTDLVEKLEFAVRFVNSQGAETWDNNNFQNYAQRLLPSILAPTVYGGAAETLSGEVRIDFNVLLDKKFSTATVEQIGAVPSVASDSLTVVLDTSLVNNGATVKYLVKAVAFGKSVVQKTFEFKVFNTLVKETIALPQDASDFWSVAVSAENSSQLILSSLGNYYSSNQYVVFDKDSEQVVSRGKFGEGLIGQLVVDAQDKKNVYIFSEDNLAKVSREDLSTVVYKIDLDSLQFCYPKSVAISSKYLFVMDSCGGKLVVLDKSTGTVKATIGKAEGLEEQFLSDVVVDRETDSVYVFAGSVVRSLNGATLKVEKTWKGELFANAVALSGNGVFWTYGFGSTVEAVQLTEDLKIKSLGKFGAESSSRVLSGIVGLADQESAIVLDVQKNQLLKFTLPASEPLIM